MKSQDTSDENQSAFKCQKFNKITEEFVCECEGCEERACLNWPQEIDKTLCNMKDVRRGPA